MNNFNNIQSNRVLKTYQHPQIIQSYQNLQQKQPTFVPIRYNIPSEYIHQSNDNKFVQIPLQMTMNTKKGPHSVNKVLDINLNINFNELLQTKGEKPQINVKLGRQKIQSTKSNSQFQFMPKNIQQVKSQTIKYNLIQNQNQIPTIQYSNNFRENIKTNAIPGRQDQLKRSKINQISDLLSGQDYIHQKYVMPPKVIQILTCVICKQKYEVGDINSHAEKHRKHYQPPKIKNSKMQYFNNNKQLKPNYRPIIEPQQCYVKPPQNIHVVQKVNKSISYSLLNQIPQKPKQIKKQEIILNQIELAPQTKTNKVTYQSKPSDYEIIVTDYINNPVSSIDEVNMNTINIQEQNIVIQNKSRNRASRNLKLNLGKNSNA